MPNLLPTADCRLPTERSSLPPVPCRLSPKRSAISLLEVLISMFVLLVGLMGAASLFPVGNNYAAKSERYGRAASLAETAFDELEARGILRPGAWLYGNGAVSGQTDIGTLSDSLADQVAVIQPTHVLSGGNRVSNPQTNRIGFFNLSNFNIGPGRAFVIDPIGVASASEPPAQYFPFWNSVDDVANTEMPNVWKSSVIQESAWPIRRVTLPVPDNTIAGGATAMATEVADSIFSLHDTLAVEYPDEDDRPSIQRWMTVDNDPATGKPNGTPDDNTDDTLLRRQYAADYSWLATVVPVTADGIDALQPAHAEYGSRYYDVSVAVFHRRESDPTTGERLVEANLLVGGELELIHDSDPSALDEALQDLSTGEWIALAGVNQTNGIFLMKWYRILSMESETPTEKDEHGHYVRHVTLDGPNWPGTPNLSTPDPSDFLPEVENLRAIILPNVISVTTRSIKMEN